MTDNQHVHNSAFTGRSEELHWLRNNFQGFRESTIVISGVGGVGKTALIRNFLATTRLSLEPLWIDPTETDGRPYNVSALIQGRLSEATGPRGREFAVVLDDATQLDDDQLSRAIGQIYNWKAVRGILIATRRQPELTGPRSLALGPLDEESAKNLLESFGYPGIPIENLNFLIGKTGGNPLAIQLLAGVARTAPNAFARLLAESIYDFAEATPASPSEVIAIARPAIISASEALVRDLQKRPEDLLSISPRDFERILAELLTDMGWEVELTKATRDGGKDLLAYMNTDVGRLLCLVEAKRYRADRKIGVELVRTLYGTFCDFQANSAMMVTTSSFSPEARQFQQKHQYQLSLKEYSDVVEWISNFGRKGRTT